MLVSASLVVYSVGRLCGFGGRRRLAGLSSLDIDHSRLSTDDAVSYRQ